MKQKKDKNENVNQYMVRLIVSDNENFIYHKNRFSLVANYTIVKLMICIDLLKKLVSKKFGFWKCYLKWAKFLSV